MGFLRLPRRRARLSREVHNALPLNPGERVLAWGLDTLGRAVVATDLALLLPRGAGSAGDAGLGDGAWDPMPWHRILRARWDRETQGFVLEAVDGDTGQSVIREVFLDEESTLPETVRERVTSTIALTRHVRLLGRDGVRIVARRLPGEVEPEWQLVFDPALDPADPELRARAEAALDGVRREALL